MTIPAPLKEDVIKQGKRMSGRPGRWETLAKGSVYRRGQTVREIMDATRWYVEFRKLTHSPGPGTMGVPDVVTTEAFSRWLAQPETEKVPPAEAEVMKMALL